MSLILRSARLEDAPALLTYFRSLVTGDADRVGRPEEAARMTVASEREWIARRLLAEANGERALLVAEDGQAIVALGEVERMPRWIERHVGEIRFGALPGHALAAALLVDALIARAQDMDIDVLVYMHLASQHTGIQVMRAAGFTECGRIPGYYRRDAEEVDRIYLVRTEPRSSRSPSGSPPRLAH